MGTQSTMEHPPIYSAPILVLGTLLGVFGAIIGLELIVRVGVNPNTSIIGALIAIAVSYIPLRYAKAFKNVHAVNLMQTVISAATFQAGNVFLLTIAIPYLLGAVSSEFILPVFIGIAYAALIDLILAYNVFDSPFYPARNPWPVGVSTAEAIKAAMGKGKRALLLLYGMIFGGTLTYLGYPGDVVGITLITQIIAITAFGIGLLLRAYGPTYLGVDLYKLYAPQGIMIGAGIAAIIQFIILWLNVRRKSKRAGTSSGSDIESSTFISADRAIKALVITYILWTLGAFPLGFFVGMYTGMNLTQIVLWALYYGFGAWWTTLVCGISGMYAGWFPAFATALASLVIGLLFGFPPLAQAVGVGYVAATGPGMADLCYDLKTGWILRGEGKDRELERIGRWWQFWAKILAMAVSITLVLLFYRVYFSLNLFPPASRTLAATAKAAADPQLARWLLIWAPIGFILQLIGGAERQIGILLATGLMIFNPAAGIAVIATVIARLMLTKIYGAEKLRDIFYVGGAGAVGGSAIVSFTIYTLRAFLRM